MEVHNKDIHPDKDTLELFPKVAFLTNNRFVQNEFDRYELAAVGLKRIYHLCGKLAVWLTTLSAIYSVIFVASGIQFPLYLSWAAITGAGIALALYAYLLIGRPKAKWLIARFAAERIRSIKFQAFLLVSGSEEHLESRIDAFCREKLVQLKDELNRGEVAITEFVPSRVISKGKMEPWTGSPQTLQQARDAYQALRLDYQKGFADAAEYKIIETKAVGRALSDFLFVSGALLVLLVLSEKALGIIANEKLEIWLEALSVTIFILSAAFSITEKASIAEISKARYYEYATALDHIKIASDAIGAVSLQSEVIQVEELALRELQQFSVSALLTSYRI